MKKLALTSLVLVTALGACTFSAETDVNGVPKTTAYPKHTLTEGQKAGANVKVGHVSESSPLAKHVSTTLQFASGKGALTRSHKDTIADLLAHAEKLPRFDVEVTGFSDRHGSERTREATAEHRLSNVVEYLEAHGVPRAHVHSKVEIEKIISGKSTTADELNRRVEIKIIPIIG